MTKQPTNERKKLYKGVTSGLLGLSALTLGLWFGGTTLAVSSASETTQKVKIKEVDERIAELKSRASMYKPQKIFRNHSKRDFFQYALLDNQHFEPNIWTDHIPGINDTAELTGGNPNTVGIARMVTLRKPGLPTDPSDPRSHVGVYLDISGLKTIKAETGWYEATIMYTTRIPPIAPARPDGHAQFGYMTPEDAEIMAAQGTGNNVPGNVFSKGGVAPRYPAKHDVWPDDYTSLVTFPLTAGTFNALSMDDAHHYFEFRPETNMVFPHQEFPFAGGVYALHPPEGAYKAGTLGHFLSIVPGSGPLGINNNDPMIYGDNPADPRDPDRFQAFNPDQREFRLRSVPSGLTEEIHRDVFTRRASFHPEETNLQTRLYLSLAYQYSLIDQNNDGVLTFEELDINGMSDGRPNTRLYFPITEFDRYIIQREINDGMIVPRFANSQRAWVLSGNMKQIVRGAKVKN